MKVIISGTLIKMKDTIEINSRLIDTQDGSIIKAEKRKAERIADLESAVEDLATQIKGDFPLFGYIVHVSPPDVMIDLGWKHGASSQQAFIVFREGKQIIHPTTNQVLAIEEIQVAEIRLSDVDRITSTGYIVRQCEGKKIQVGDRVRTPTATLSPSKPMEAKVESKPDTKPLAAPRAGPERLSQKGSRSAPSFSSGGAGRDGPPGNLLPLPPFALTGGGRSMSRIRRIIASRFSTSKVRCSV